MTKLLNLPPQTEARLEAEALRRGVSADDLACEVLTQWAAQAPKTNAERKAALRAARGSIAHLPLSVDKFLEEKHADIERENKEVIS
jgi:hypothetical protein